MWLEPTQTSREPGVIMGRSSCSSSGSEVVMMDHRVMEAATHSQPAVTNLNVTRSSRVHIGPKFVSVTQNVDNTSVVKDLPIHRYIWNVVKNTTKAERITCAVATVILIICIILIMYFIKRAKKTEETIDVAPHEWYITRDMWLAPKFITLERTDDNFNPLRLVIVAHSVSSTCPRFKKCASEMRNLQEYYLKHYNYNLPYNFLIGNDGRVYEGRGWNTVGAHTRGYNRCSLGLAFIGDYREGSDSYTTVTDLQLKRAQMLFQEGVRLEYLHRDFEVIGAKDVQSTLSPGTNLYNAIRQWPNYAHNNIYRNRTCEQIYALFKNASTTAHTTKVD